MTTAVWAVGVRGWPFAGFFGKYYLFSAAIQADIVWLTICGVAASVISVWFYLGLVVNMFFREPETEAGMSPCAGAMSKTALLVTIAGTLVVGFIPELILRLVSR